MSIADRNRIAELEARVAALEKILMAETKQCHASESKPVIPAALRDLPSLMQEVSRETLKIPLKVRRG